MKRIIASIVILLCGFSSSGQNKNLDSLYHLLEKHRQEDSSRVKLLYQICYYEYTSDNEKNKVHATEALSISQNIHFAKGIGYAQKYLALYYWVSGGYEEATTHALEMLKAFEGTTNYKGFGQAYALLGSIHQDSRNFEKAESYYLKAIEVHARAGLKSDLGYDYNSIGTLYQSFQKPDEALAYNMKAMAIRKELADENGLSQTYANMILIYKTKKDYTKALEYAQMALPILEKLNNKFRLCALYGNVGAIYTLTGDYAKSESYLFKSLALAKAMNRKLVLEEIYENLADLENKKGDYKKAFAYLNTKQQYKDSIYSEEKAKTVAEIETRYETAKKDITIQSLEQQRQLQSLKQLYSFIGVIVLIIAFAIIYYLQRNYNKNVNRLLDTEKSLNQKLLEADQLKSSFFANISHEFRTPLSLILAPIEEKLSSNRFAPSDKESFQLIRRNANRLLTLVNQLLDLSKLEAKKMELQIHKGNLKEFVTVLTASFDSLAENKRIHFEKDIRIDIEESWYDTGKLETIINNLLFNAFKFTSAGGTVIFSSTLATPTEDLQIKISDTGKGIPPEELENVFSPFYQARNVADDGQIGTGLGLSMVKELVNLYGGTIQLESAINKGTVITITLPVRKESFPTSVIHDSVIPVPEVRKSSIHETLEVTPEDDETEELFDNPEPHNDTVLIVEDNEDLRNFISATLRAHYTILTAKDGEEGLALAIDQIPDLVISDVMMPNMNGIQLTEKVKGDDRTSHIPVVLLTAKADHHSRLEGLQTGADDYLSKPFATDELRVRVANLIEQRKKLAAKYREGILQPHLQLPMAPIEPSMDDKFLARARQIVNDNISDSNFGVEKMADEINLSRTQLFRKLKAISGLSPNELINDIRLQKAADLISARADTLTQISYSVGYSEQSYFAKRFRKKFGVTPGEYQARQANIRQSVSPQA